MAVQECGIVELESLKARIGQELGVSDWIEVSQARINAFADTTEDHQFIHVDPVAAAMTPFGGPIAHGFLVIALLSRMVMTAGIAIEGVAMGVNYGFDRVRLTAPVPAGSRMRGRFNLVGVEARKPGQFLITFGVTVELEGGTRPALTAEWLTLYFAAA